MVMWMCLLPIQHPFTSSFLRGPQFCPFFLPPGLTLDPNEPKSVSTWLSLRDCYQLGTTQVILFEPKKRTYSLGLGEKSSLALSCWTFTRKPVAPIAIVSCLSS